MNMRKSKLNRQEKIGMGLSNYRTYILIWQALLITLYYVK